MNQARTHGTPRPSGAVTERLLAEALLTCEREAIHLPGSIQSHGALVAFDDRGTLRMVSANLGDWLPIEAATRARPMRHLADLLGEADASLLEQAVGRRGAPGQHSLIEIPAQPALHRVQALGVLVHRQGDLLIAEFEPLPPAGEASKVDQQVLQQLLESLRGSPGLQDLQHRIARQVRQLTGCDRVMVYRFHDDWHGEVMADAHAEDMESFLGLHYPAGDIPSQARELYRVNPVRYLPDVDAAPVALQPCVDDALLQPLDLSHAMLRSVSPVHLQYLRNMGVRATLTLSLCVDGRLWGLVACHHRTPLTLTLALRLACQELAFQLGLMIGWAEQRQQAIDLNLALQAQVRIVERFNCAHLPIADLIERSSSDLLSLVSARSGAFWLDGTVSPFGNWPGGAMGAAILRRVHADFEVTSDDLLATDALLLEDGTSAVERRGCCGLLALRLDPRSRAGLVWLRPEQRREVIWGGNPDHAAQVSLDADGQLRISPRTSFARWEQTVALHSRAWTPADRTAARSLRALRAVLQLRDALAESRRSDSQFRSLVAVQGDAYWQIDAQGLLVALNKPMHVIDGPMFGRPWLELLAPLLDAPSLQGLREALARRVPFRELRLQGSDPDEARSFTWRLNGTPLRQADGGDAGWHGTLNDISAEAALQRTRDQRDLLQQTMLDNDLIAMLKLREGRISWCNRAMERLFGVAAPMLDGRSLLSLCADAERAGPLLEQGLADLSAGKTHRSQLAMVTAEGHRLWIGLSAMSLGGTHDESMWLLNDLTTMRAVQDLAEHQARHDSLTRLPNRAAMLERLEQELASAARSGGSVALCYLDLDGFKPINDRHGHAAGDEVLRALSQRMLALVRREDIVSRFGGDEFVILLTHAGTRDDLDAWLHRLIAALAQPVRLESRETVSVTASVGIAVSPWDGRDAQALIQRADAALYDGKAKGGNRICHARDLAQPDS